MSFELGEWSAELGYCLSVAKRGLQAFFRIKQSKTCFELFIFLKLLKYRCFFGCLSFRTGWERAMALSNTSIHSTTKGAQTVADSSSNWKIKLLYDGECPLCMREVNFLQKRDAGRGLVAFVDIAADDYTAEANGGVDFETAMGRIHAVLPDGTLVQKVEVFRRVYEVLGMGWIYFITKLPIIGWLADALYDFWADRRLALTGRPSLATVLAERQQQRECDTEGRCRL